MVFIKLGKLVNTSARASILAEVEPHDKRLKFSTLDIITTWELMDAKCDSTYSKQHIPYYGEWAKVDAAAPDGPATS